MKEFWIIKSDNWTYLLRCYDPKYPDPYTVIIVQDFNMAKCILNALKGLKP